MLILSLKLLKRFVKIKLIIHDSCLYANDVKSYSRSCFFFDFLNFEEKPRVLGLVFGEDFNFLLNSQFTLNIIFIQILIETWF